MIVPQEEIERNSVVPEIPIRSRRYYCKYKTLDEWSRWMVRVIRECELEGYERERMNREELNSIKL